MADATQTINMVEDEHNPFVNGLLDAAQKLADDKTELLKRIAANRDTLRNMQTQRFMSPEQSASVDEFYPKRIKENGQAPEPSKPTGLPGKK